MMVLMAFRASNNANPGWIDNVERRGHSNQESSYDLVAESLTLVYPQEDDHSTQ